MIPRKTYFGPLAGLRYQRARLTFKPMGIALYELRQAFQNENTALHRTREACLLAQFASSSPAGNRDGLGHLISYIRASRSMRGLESLFLTAVHTAWLEQDRLMHTTACEIWSFLREIEASKALPHANAQVIFFDRETHLATVMTPNYWDRISGRVFNGALAAQNIGLLIRTFGNGEAADGFTNFVGCVSSFTTVAAGIGGGVGLGIGYAGGGLPGAGAVGGIGALAGGFAGFSFGLGYCGADSLFGNDKGGGDKGGGDKGGGPVSDAEGQGGTVIAGDSQEGQGGQGGQGDQGGQGGQGDQGGQGGQDGQSDQGGEGDEGGTGDSVETAVGMPAPDDIHNMQGGFIELVSSRADGGDDTRDKSGSPGGPKPNTAMLGVATYALHGLGALAKAAGARR